MPAFYSETRNLSGRQKSPRGSGQTDATAQGTVAIKCNPLDYKAERNELAGLVVLLVQIWKEKKA